MEMCGLGQKLQRGYMPGLFGRNGDFSKTVMLKLHILGR